MKYKNFDRIMRLSKRTGTPLIILDENGDSAALMSLAHYERLVLEKGEDEKNSGAQEKQVFAPKESSRRDQEKSLTGKEILDSMDWEIAKIQAERKQEFFSVEGTAYGESISKKDQKRPDFRIPEDRLRGVIEENQDDAESEAGDDMYYLEASEEEDF